MSNYIGAFWFGGAFFCMAALLLAPQYGGIRVALPPYVTAQPPLQTTTEGKAGADNPERRSLTTSAI